jgi:hypothetical protein
MIAAKDLKHNLTEEKQNGHKTSVSPTQRSGPTN